MLLILIGALAYLLQTKLGRTEPNWDDILIIGLGFDLILIVTGLFLGLFPVRTVGVTTIGISPLPTLILKALITFVTNYIQYMIGVILAPAIRYVSRTL